MADLQPAIEAAATTGGAVAVQSANGNLWAFLTLATAGVFILLGIYIWRVTGKPKAAPPPAAEAPPRRRDDDCDPPSSEGCPAIKLLANRIDRLSEQIADDRIERRDHRREVREDVLRIHQRLDALPEQFAGKEAVQSMIKTFEHFTEEASRIAGAHRHHAAG